MNLFIDILSTVIEGWGLVYLTKSELIFNKSKIIFLVAFTIVFQVLTHLIYLDRIWIKFLVGFSIIICMSRHILQISFTKSFFYMSTGYMLLVLGELCINQIATLFNVELGEGYTAPTISIIVGKIIYVTLIIFVQKVIESVSNQGLNIKSLISFSLSNIGYSVVGICIFMNINKFQGTVYTNVFIGCSIVMLISLIINVWFTERYLEMEKKEKDQMIAIYELELNAKYYEDKLREEDTIKKVYHDLKNHLLLLEDVESRPENPSESIDIIRKDISKYEDYFRTGNRFLDIILRDKRGKAEQNEICLEDDIDFQKGGFIDAVDISTIFGNLLDNAIEACKLIPENDKRVIQIVAKPKNRLLVITLKNTIAINPPKIDRKNRKIISGYGLLNIENAVHKYGGEVSLTRKDDIFKTDIIIPIKEEKRK